MKRLFCVTALCLGWSACAGTEWTNRFSAVFTDYADGEPLSDKGAVGGRWSVAEGVSVRNAFDGERNAIRISGCGPDDVRFEADDPAAAGSSVRIGFSVCIDEFEFDPTDCPPEGSPAAIAAAADEAGRPALAGWTGDGWAILQAEGVAFEPDKWIDGFIELRTLGGRRLVSYAVGTDGDFTRLRFPGGEEWMPAAPKTGEGEVSVVGYCGNARVSRLSGDDRAAAAETRFLWNGGDGGDWDDSANWTDGAGGAVGRAPGQDGDVAALGGTVTVTNGDDVTVARDLRIAFADGAALRIGGTFDAPVSLDVSRPRVGRAIAPEVGNFLGCGPDYAYAWFRGDSFRDYGVSPVSSRAAYVPTEADDCGHWLKLRVSDRGSGMSVFEREFFFSKLPVVYINTVDGEEITVKGEYKSAALRIQGNGEFKEQYDGATEIKGRGNSSWGYPKKPYKLKLGSKTNLFGYGKNKHWVLLSNWLDECYLRNWLAGDIAATLGVLRMDMTWVDVVFNGDFRGNYMLGEHIRVDPNRVDVFDWSDVIDDKKKGREETDLSWMDGDPGTDVSGGHIFELSEEYDEVSEFTTGRGLKVMVDTPEYANTSARMFGAMRGMWADYEDAYAAEDGYGTNGLHYTEMADLASMAGYWLVQETMGNNDGSYKSRYVHKDIGGKLTFGPVWDFDWGCGSAADKSSSAGGWRVSGRNDGANLYREWLNDPLFCLKAFELYWTAVRPHMMEEVLGADGILAGKIAYLKESAEADRRRWKDETYFAEKGWTRRWFDGDSAAFVRYLTERMAWLDRQFATLDTFVKSVQMSHSANPYAKDDALAFAVSGEAAAQPVTACDCVVVNARDVEVSVTVGDASVARVHFQVNGLKVGSADVVGGSCAFTVPCTALDVAPGARNILMVIAKDASGATVARNYATLMRDATPEAESVGRQLQEDYGFAADSEVVGKIVTQDEFVRFRTFLAGAAYDPAAPGSAARQAHAYGSFLLAPVLKTPYLFLNEPELAIAGFGPAVTPPGWDVAVELRDGSDTVAMAAEALREAVRKSEDLRDWSPVGRDDIVPTAGEGNRVILKVNPSFAGDRGFLRLECR